MENLQQTDNLQQTPVEYGGGQPGEEVDPGDLGEQDEDLQEEIVDDENIEEYMYRREFKCLTLLVKLLTATEMRRSEKATTSVRIWRTSRADFFVEAELAKNKIKELKEQNERRKKEELKERHLNEVRKIHAAL